ncbi:VanZ family protein [Priestia flexa]|uniref:VanZ family protein n=1 Tax=Priestia flexa TaxID=86664 RepID=A0A8I1MIU3_9BACI|nr:VanZ family protein [Priestia flexa]MBN8253494.1 VanZ family protein [Priestia flexa]MBN8435623.1 VanZ family protein [Priestia flexa]MCA0968181.1 VanZ family protein [Priestia flexa]RIV09252.1 VanZ family protein [Priestia flexa]UIR30497.1 VanZ family protein [Priestia flexa]
MTDKTKKKVKQGLFFLFIIYGVALIYVTLIKENEQVYGQAMNLSLFSTIKLMWDSGNLELAVVNVLGNIVMFAPVGMFIPLFMKSFDGFIQVFVTGFLISFTIEILQYELTERVFDIDDILLNSIGTLVGWILVKLLFFFKRLILKQ